MQNYIRGIARVVGAIFGYIICVVFMYPTFRTDSPEFFVPILISAILGAYIADGFTLNLTRGKD